MAGRRFDVAGVVEVFSTGKQGVRRGGWRAASGWAATGCGRSSTLRWVDPFPGRDWTHRLAADIAVRPLRVAAA